MPYRISIGPDHGPEIQLPRAVLQDALASTFCTRDDAQDALDALADEINEHNPERYASAGLYALEVDDVACFHIDGPED